MTNIIARLKRLGKRIAIPQTEPSQPGRNEGRNWDDSNPRTNGEVFLIEAYAPQWRLCVDIGANRGDYAKQILATNPACRVLCFEPNPELANALHKDARFEVYSCAVGDTVGRVVMHINDRDPGLSSLWRKTEATRSLEVDQTTLDHFCSEHGIQTIDFVKIDTEGNEVRVVKGAAHLIVSDAIGMIQFEYGGTYRDAGTSLQEMYQLLGGRYMICHLLAAGLLPLPYLEDLETYRYSNWVAISRRLYTTVYP